MVPPKGTENRNQLLPRRPQAVKAATVDFTQQGNTCQMASLISAIP